MREDLIPRFVRVPAREFVMGSDEGADDERPAHRVAVDAFYASVHPITVEQYAQFTRETGHGAPGIRDLPMVVTPAHESAFRELAAPYVWRGGEPPRERAARGERDGSRYPWGNVVVGSHANFLPDPAL